MSAKFTPGPWTWDFDRDDEQNAIVWLANDDNMRVCFLAHCAKVSETHANAALIAAAPDLYAVLTKAAWFVRNFPESHIPNGFGFVLPIEHVEATLKKARGET